MTEPRRLRMPRRSLLLAVVFLLLVFGARTVRAETGRAEGWAWSAATEIGRRGKLSLRYEPQLRSEAEILLEHAPRWWSELEAELDGDLDDALSITLLEHPGAVAEGTGMPRWVAGVAQPRRGEIVVARYGPDGSPTDLERLLRHEMAHVALDRAVGGRSLPRWLHEGVAESLERTIDLERARTLAFAVFGGGVPSLTELERDFRGVDAQAAGVAYAASRDLVNHLRAFDGRGAAFRQLLTELRLGRDLEAGFVHAYGSPLSDLVRGWRKELPGRFVWAPLIATGGMPVFVVAPLLFGAWLRRRRQRRRGWERLAREDERELRRLLPLSRAPMALPGPA